MKMKKKPETKVPAIGTKREIEILNAILLLLAEFGEVEPGDKARARILNAVEASLGWSPPVRED